MVTFSRARLLPRAGVLVTAGALLLAGCAETSSGGGDTNGGGEGVAFGATMEEYQAAFADVDPIVLHTQSPSTQGSTGGAFIDAYTSAVEEWSDGKITFDIAYSDAIAKSTEIDNAIVDGRLDIGQVLAVYEPQEFPATSALLDASVLSDQSVVTGVLQSNAWPADVALNTPEIVSEFEDKGMKLMLPAYNAGMNALFCSDKRVALPDYQGRSISVGSTAGNQQVSALGATPTSVAYTEAYEALQRGVIDCSMLSPAAAQIGGILEVAPQTVIDPEAGLAVPSGNMAMNLDVWDSLPLVAQQLMWDRLDAFMTGSIEGKIWPVTVDSVKDIQQYGGSIEPFADDARTAVQDANNKIVDAIAGNSGLSDGAGFVTSVRESADKWSQTITELGYTNETDYNGFATWYTPGKIDIAPYIERVYEEIYLPHRPS
ncbi:C4-dicarboxylate ABC transporter substrate-binding protein [Rhodococcus sp. HNM0563]|uniref:C4-dicarboxylate ABC transporter substrate-binding protein n=1 Tax=Rhodococcus sp. HNM0563 TaxID=2716339 RepID=UPI00146B006C|nr:C4-dicarboxylate ABC transporter substrate-binding protein [Rhodococcus sp. HNM0563]